MRSYRRPNVIARGNLQVRMPIHHAVNNPMCRNGVESRKELGAPGLSESDAIILPQVPGTSTAAALLPIKSSAELLIVLKRSSPRTTPPHPQSGPWRHCRVRFRQPASNSERETAVREFSSFGANHLLQLRLEQLSLWLLRSSFRAQVLFTAV
jgi:hypothetical protein